MARQHKNQLLLSIKPSDTPRRQTKSVCVCVCVCVCARTVCLGEQGRAVTRNRHTYTADSLHQARISVSNGVNRGGQSCEPRFVFGVEFIRSLLAFATFKRRLHAFG